MILRPGTGRSSCSTTSRRRSGSTGCRRSRSRPRASASPSTAANVPAQDEAQVIAEVRLQAARPVALPRLLPLGRLLNLGCGQVVERHVLAVAAGAAKAPGAEDTRDGDRKSVV